jgi:YVTN family beta-propeller protein
MEFRILGPLEVEDGGRPVPIGGGRQRALLALLVMRPNEVVSQERLIDELWGAAAPETAAKSLHNQVSALRRSLGDGVIVTRAPGYELEVEPDVVDAQRFERLVEEARTEVDPAVARERLREALGLWRGPPLQELAGEEFTQGEIRRLEELRLVALEGRIDAELALGGGSELVPELEALVQEHPLRERLRGQLMLALYRGGRQAEALEAFGDARRTLVQELGLEPSERLRRLERSILTQDPTLEAVTATFAGTSVTGMPARSTRRADRPIPPNSVALIDPDTDRVAAHVPVGWRPAAVAVGHDSVWVANADDGTVSRIDPSSLTVVRTIGIGAPVIDLDAGPDALWSANGSDGTLSRIDPSRDAVVHTLDLRGPNELLANPTHAVAVSTDALWVATGSRTLLRIDPETGETTATIDVGHTPVCVTFYEGAVWVATLAQRVLRVEPRTNVVSAEAAIGFPLAAAAGEGRVWTADNQGRLWSINPDTAAVTQTIPVGERPVGVVVGEEAVWVADNAEGAVRRIDPRSGQVVDVVTVGHAPTDVAFGEGGVWVSIQSEAAI